MTHNDDSQDEDLIDVEEDQVDLDHHDSQMMSQDISIDIDDGDVNTHGMDTHLHKLSIYPLIQVISPSTFSVSVLSVLSNLKGTYSCLSIVRTSRTNAMAPRTLWGLVLICLSVN